MKFACLLFLWCMCCVWHDSNALIVSKATANRILRTGQLVFTNVLYRHGDRMPLPLCPNDPLNNPDFWPKEWSQLTDLGTRQQYALGQWLRKRYDSLLSRTYKPSQIYIRSTDTDRTIASALANLAGLYQPLVTELWHKDIRWQPISVHTVPAENDYLMGLSYCPKFEQIYLDYLNSTGILARCQPLFNYYTLKCGHPVDTLLELDYIYDRFDVEELLNMPVPPWAKPYYGTPEFEYLFYLGFVARTNTPELARFKGGPLIKEMLTNMKYKHKGVLNPDRSMWMYSAHDTTISAVLNSLNMYNFTGPPYSRPGYASVLLMELILDKRLNPYVSIVYRQDTNSEPEILTIPKCGLVCPLESMFTLYKDILPVDIVGECQV